MSRKSPEAPRSRQIDRFVETARVLGADEDEAAFKEKLAVIARQKAKVDAPPPKPRKGRRPA